MSQNGNFQDGLSQSPKSETASGRYMPAEEVSLFCEQVALVLGSGVPLYDGIEALCDNYKTTSFHAAFASINEGVKQTGSLYQALTRVRAFPPYMVEMVKIGEQTGKLDHVMGQLSAYYLRESKIRRSVRNAVVYPLGLLCMMAVVILVLVVKVLPVFDQVYKGLGTEMSGGAATIMQFGTGVGNGVLWAAAVLIVLVLAIVALLKTRVRQPLVTLISKIFPPLRRIYRFISAGRFASNMGMMLDSGYPLEEALPLVAAVFEDPVARAQINLCNERMQQGNSFPESVAAAGIFDKLHNKMVQMGFVSGRTDSVMNRLAYLYEEELDHSISRAVAMIEPAMVALLSVIIGAILLSVMLPMVSIMSSIL